VFGKNFFKIYAGNIIIYPESHEKTIGKGSDSTEK
jgi:hypothetical protein